MRRGAVLGGIGAIAFGALTVVAFALANPPGGTYAPSDAATFLTKGHRVVLYIALYLAMVSVLGLIGLLSHLRDAVAEQPEHRSAAPPVTYLVSEVGTVMIFGVGSILLGIALIALPFTARTLFPSWLRWLTVIGGVGAFASPAFFPSVLLVVWALVIGVWLLASGRHRAAAPSRPPAGVRPAV